MPDVFEVLGAAHREVEQMLDRMQAMMSVPAELRDQGGALADTLISVWPGLRTVLSADQATALGEKLARATKAGPTRPHPHTPPSPAVLKAAGPAVAAADKLRDAASGRDN